jgi:protein SCO1
MTDRIAARNWVLACLTTAFFAVVCMALARAEAPIAKVVEKVGIDQHLDAQVPLDLPFVDEGGRNVKLSDYFGGKPVVLVLAYYRCPMLCTEVLNGLLKSSQAVKFRLSADYQIVTVSIDPRETPELARAKKRRYADMYRREGAEAGWHFLTGPQESITRLAETVGFRYQFDPVSDQFAHGSGIILLTPHGKISRYFYGIEYPPNDLRLGLVESSAGKIGSAVDAVLLLCYHYDPQVGKYGLMISRLMRFLASVTVLALGTFLFVMFRQERRRSQALRASRFVQHPPTAADRA